MARLLLVLVAAICLAGCGGGVNGSRFTGDGYSVVIPADLGLEYSRVSGGGDSWAVAPGSPGIVVAVSVLRMTMSGGGGPITSLEAALQRANDALAGGKIFPTMSAEAVALPAGGAYRLTPADGGSKALEAFVFYSKGAGYLLILLNLPAGLGEKVADTFQTE